MPNHNITVFDLQRARELFESSEPRDLFYRVATELVGLVIAGQTAISLSEAVAVLLQTWNREFYRFRGGFKTADFTAIDNLINSYRMLLLALREKNIHDFDPRDRTAVIDLFERFEEVLGPVGAAKALHVLCPTYLPIWDRKIAAGYVGNLQTGRNGDRYWRMMEYVAAQSRCLLADGYNGNCLKAIDEYNYCHFTKGWI